MRFSSPVQIVAAKRSAIGKFGGSLASFSAVDLATLVAENLLCSLPDFDRNIIDSAVFGQVLSAGGGMNLARQCLLKLGVHQDRPGYTVNMVCGSGLQSVALAAREIESGESHVVLAGGAESMSSAPYLATDTRWGRKLGHAGLIDSILSDALTDPQTKISMGETAERIAESYSVSRESQDNFALQSQQRAIAARTLMAREIAPITAPSGLIEIDEHPRPDTTLGKLARLKPAFRDDGSVTAGNSSGLNDGAAVLMLASGDYCELHAVNARARVVGSCAVGCDPTLMGLGPVGAIGKLANELSWQLGDVEAIEINEAFAAQTITCARLLGIRPEKLNQRGGAIALGHPVGASGARILVTLLHLMEDNGYKRGIASLCIGGGMGIAIAIER